MYATGLKKTAAIVENANEIFALDELYWFINRKGGTKTRENIYVITMARRQPRQIVGFDIGSDKTAERMQRIADGGPDAEKYATDGYSGYLDAIFPGGHVRNVHNKKDTFTVEGINADLRRFIPLLRRRGRCFARSLETLKAVMAVFVEAYNKFGLAKFKYRQANPNRSVSFGLVDFL